MVCNSIQWYSIPNQHLLLLAPPLFFFAFLSFSPLSPFFLLLPVLLPPVTPWLSSSCRPQVNNICIGWRWGEVAIARFDCIFSLRGNSCCCCAGDVCWCRALLFCLLYHDDLLFKFAHLFGDRVAHFCGDIVALCDSFWGALFLFHFGALLSFNIFTHLSVDCIALCVGDVVADLHLHWVAHLPGNIFANLLRHILACLHRFAGAGLYILCFTDLHGLLLHHRSGDHVADLLGHRAAHHLWHQAAARNLSCCWLAPLFLHRLAPFLLLPTARRLASLWVDQFLEGLLQVSNYLGDSLTHATNQVPNWIRLPPSLLAVPPGCWWKVGGWWWVTNLHLHPPALLHHHRPALRVLHGGGGADLLFRIGTNILCHIGANFLLHWHSNILLHV